MVPWAFLFRLGQIDPYSPLSGFALVTSLLPPLYHFSALCPCSHPGPTFFSEITLEVALFSSSFPLFLQPSL